MTKEEYLSKRLNLNFADLQFNEGIDHALVILRQQLMLLMMPPERDMVVMLKDLITRVESLKK